MGRGKYIPYKWDSIYIKRYKTTMNWIKKFYMCKQIPKSFFYAWIYMGRNYLLVYITKYFQHTSIILVPGSESLLIIISGRLIEFIYAMVDEWRCEAF